MSLEKVVEYIKRKLMWIANQEVDEYIECLKNGREPSERKVPLIVEKMITDALKTEMSTLGRIEVEKAKKRKIELKPIEVKIIEAEKKEIPGSCEGKESGRGTEGSTDADGC